MIGDRGNRSLPFTLDIGDTTCRGTLTPTTTGWVIDRLMLLDHTQFGSYRMIVHTNKYLVPGVELPAEFNTLSAAMGTVTALAARHGQWVMGASDGVS